MSVATVDDPSDSWISGFISRNNEKIKEARPKGMPVARIASSTPEVIAPYFDQLESLLKTNEYPPALILNFDETAIQADNKTKKVLITFEKKRGIVPLPDSRYRFTLCACIAADGSHLKPLVILPGKKLPYLPEEIVSECELEVQENSSIDKEKLERYVDDVVIPWINQKRIEIRKEESRAMFILDNHTTRKNEGLMEKFFENRIDVLFLPPNTTHLTQPLDVVVFSSMKSQLSTKIKRRVNMGEPLAEMRVKMIESALECYQTSCSSFTVRKAFKMTGIVPFNRRLVLENCDVGSCPLELVHKQKKILNNMTLTGEVMKNKLQSKRLEKEKIEKEKEEKRKQKIENKRLRELEESNKQTKKQKKTLESDLP